MNKADAKRIAETITHAQLAEMFERAKKGITDWEKVSAVNPGMTKGTAWNILSAALNASGGARVRQLAVTNMIWEFGDFLDDSLKPAKKKRQSAPDPYHEQPNF
ncbi:hypothetical protein PMM47T1_14140 [Pseudomonas sp. M47T1]|uniref:hypothetical protein n=1 Tax=Pseudomonas sp. M47T1 TaxID=1179778 RepID=UPI0002608848|nr:hypothetical protein [Pseudomonas sp. M47T1]EIK96106.1 hypothetical protein PMM47T1_14140 [Pseudomonas sp. M47T1]